VETLKRLSEIIPFLEPYPAWVKVLVSGWTLLSAVMLISLVFAPRRSQNVEPFHLSGKVVSTSGIPVPAASVELLIDDRRSQASTDSEGAFEFVPARPSSSVSGRIRIAAAGYRFYDRMVQIRSDGNDLGVFTLQSENPATGGNSEDLVGQLRRRQQALFAVSQDLVEKYAPVVNGGNAGIVKLLSASAIEANRPILTIAGEGRYYSFLRRTHEYGHGSDIALENGMFSTGFAGLDYGYFLNVGDVPFSQLVTSTAEPPAWLPRAKREAWEFMWSYVPPTARVDVRREQHDARDRAINRISVSERAAAVPGNAYLLRSISFSDSDLLVAVRAEFAEDDGSIVLVWKILRAFDTPVASGPEPQP
jgi:hypothetical protein